MLVFLSICVPSFYYKVLLSKDEESDLFSSSNFLKLI